MTADPAGCPGSGSVGVEAVPDGRDLDDAVLLVEVVEDPVGAPTGGPGRRRRGIERLAHAARLVEQRPGDELVLPLHRVRGSPADPGEPAEVAVVSDYFTSVFEGEGGEVGVAGQVAPGAGCPEQAGEHVEMADRGFE